MAEFTRPGLTKGTTIETDVTAIPGLNISLGYIAWATICWPARPASDPETSGSPAGKRP